MVGELILVVDDEPNIVSLAKMYLERDGYRVESVGDGAAALTAVTIQKPVLIILDIMLPGLDGLEVCRRLRAYENPVLILMLTARDDDIDKILGLEMGADDYMVKPFNPRELVARVKAMLRRVTRTPQVSTPPFHIGNLTIDPGSREITVAGQLIPTRNQEFDLLLTLVENRGIVLTREQLLNLAWGYDYAGQTRTVDVHVGHLRKKLKDSAVRIETVSGVGYKLVVV
jgi:two-component system alkaline phosphatase synthesis response regulator PhoP